MIPTIQHFGKFKTMERVKRFVGLPRRCCCCYQVTLVVSDSVQPHRCQPTRLHRPWDSPGKNTGVGCHFLLQCMKVKSESAVAQSCPTLSDPMDWSLPGSSARGIFQARVLEWVAIAFSTWLLRDAQSTAPRAMLSCCLFSSEAHVPQRTEPAATTVGG